MDTNQFPSTLLQEAVDAFASLPGLGKKTALRLVLHLLRQEKEEVEKFGGSFIRLINEIAYCKVCYNISDQEVCNICAQASRNRKLVCVVESVKDVMSVENTHQYRGLYHVLGGIISPMDGVGPKQLKIEELVERVEKEGVEEVILALSTTMEGDTTNFYLFRQLEKTNVKVSIIARGMGIGDELEYVDELTLGRSITDRLPFRSMLK